MKKILLALLLLPSMAFAQFTTQEIEEVKKIVRARNEFTATIVTLADSVRDFGTEANRQQHADALAKGIDALVECHDAMKYLFNSTPNDWRPGKLIFVPRLPALPREDIVAQALVLVASCETKTNVWGNAALSLGNSLSNAKLISSANRLLTVVNLETFNNSLAFSSPIPPEAVFPRVVGPHGDIEEAKFATETADQKITEVLADVISFYKHADIFPDSAKNGVREAVRYLPSAINFLGNVWAMDLGVVANFNDQQAIDADVAAGSGLRSANFFRVIRQTEILMASEKMKKNFADRTLTGGATVNLQVGMGPFSDAIREANVPNTKAEIDTWWATFSNRSARDVLNVSSGMLTDFFKDMSIGWEAMDHVMASYFVFFHEINAPPPTGGLTCGENTHQVGNECVGDFGPPVPCDPCDPCPQFQAEMVLLDATTAEAQCVAVP